MVLGRACALVGVPHVMQVAVLLAAVVERLALE